VHMQLENIVIVRDVLALILQMTESALEDEDWVATFY
jgi:hypothetical protein